MTAPCILYSVGILKSEAIADRVPRRIQSQAAADLVATLQQRAPSATTSSKSHSRAVVAAAVGHRDAIALGIDVEWSGTDRRVDAISSYLAWTEIGQITTDSFYRGWTFSEAYFKAFGRKPTKSELAGALTQGQNDRMIRLSDGIAVFQERVFSNFQLTLVWQSATPEVAEPTFLAVPSDYVLSAPRSSGLRPQRG